jgi:SAM-dependent methyltransferase/catechol 2,3-dioxygenase-like lactoylglutathione lyase family enzyme
VSRQVAMGVAGLDHVQVAAPQECEAEARRFYGTLLGLEEIDKPVELRARGGVWFRCGEQQLHIGVEDGFAPAQKAHPALRVEDDGELDALAERLRQSGENVSWDEALPGSRRFYTQDPWGNRIELMSIAAPPSQDATPGWLVDESRCAGRENLDSGHVERYDAKEDGDAVGEVALLKGIGLGSDSLVVEFGAGTGQFSVAVAPACAQLIAVDVSEPMLTLLRSKVAERGLTNVQIVKAGFLSYAHLGQPADFIYSRYALHHLPDFWKALALSRLRAMLRAGGVLRLWDVVYNFAPAEAQDRIEAWCATGGDTTAAEWSRAELEEHVRDEHSTFTWLLEPMIARSGFQIEAVEHSEDGIFAKYLLRAA